MLVAHLIISSTTLLIYYKYSILCLYVLDFFRNKQNSKDKNSKSMKVGTTLDKYLTKMEGRNLKKLR